MSHAISVPLYSTATAAARVLELKLITIVFETSFTGKYAIALGPDVVKAHVTVPNVMLFGDAAPAIATIIVFPTVALLVRVMVRLGAPVVLPVFALFD